VVDIQQSITELQVIVDQMDTHAHEHPILGNE
jgi:hypothetical protein